MLPPQLDQPIVGNDALTMHGLYTGATIQAFDHASPIGSGLATGSDNWMPVSTIVSVWSISAQQSLCSPSVTSTPLVPVSAIPPPVLVGPICPAQSVVTVRNTTIDATLVLRKNSVVVGNGGAAPGDVPLSIAPPSAFAVGDQVSVVEYIGALVSPSSNVVTVNCAAQNVVTQHNNNARQGAQLAEKILTPATVSGPNFGLLFERHVVGHCRRNRSMCMASKSRVRPRMSFSWQPPRIWSTRSTPMTTPPTPRSWCRPGPRESTAGLAGQRRGIDQMAVARVTGQWASGKHLR